MAKTKTKPGFVQARNGIKVIENNIGEANAGKHAIDKKIRRRS